ncbi:hypothetical protein HK097_009148, partial [Rhizophlyctis rosea]
MQGQPSTDLLHTLVRNATAAVQRGELQAGEPLSEAELTQLARVGAQPDSDLESGQPLAEQFRAALPKLVEEGVLCQQDYGGNRELDCSATSHRVYWFSSAISGKRPVSEPMAITPPRKKQAVDLTTPHPVNKSNKATTRTPFRSPLTSSRPFRSPMPSKTLSKTTLSTPRTPSNKPASNPFIRPFKSPAIVKSTASGPSSTALSPIKSLPTPARTSEYRELEQTLRDLETRNRRLKLATKYVENDEPNKMDALIEKWTSVTREAITRLRDNIGPVIVTEQPVQRSNWGYGDDDQDTDGGGAGGSWGSEQPQPRLLTLKE